MRIFFLVLILCNLCVFGIDIEKVQASEAATEEEKNFVSHVLKEDVKAVADALIFNKVTVVGLTHTGIPLLHFPAFQGNMEMARLLIQMGADVRTTDQYEGYTAAEVAMAKGHTELANYLMAYEEEINKRYEAEDFWEGTQRQQSFTESFKHGFERGKRYGQTSWYPFLFASVIIGLFMLICWKEARKCNRNPWIWMGLTGVTLFIPMLPLLCWVPYVALRILGGKVVNPDRE